MSPKTRRPTAKEMELFVESITPMNKEAALALMKMDAELAKDRIEPEELRLQMAEAFETLSGLMEPPHADMALLMPIASRLAQCVWKALETKNMECIEKEIGSIRKKIDQAMGQAIRQANRRQLH